MSVLEPVCSLISFYNPVICHGKIKKLIADSSLCGVSSYINEDFAGDHWMAEITFVTTSNTFTTSP